MKTTIRRYIAGLLHGGAIGLIVGWFLNSGYFFRGSTEARLIFPAAMVMIITGHQINRRASALNPEAAAEQDKA